METEEIRVIEVFKFDNFDILEVETTKGTKQYLKRTSLVMPMENGVAEMGFCSPILEGQKDSFWVNKDKAVLSYWITNKEEINKVLSNILEDSEMVEPSGKRVISPF